LGAKNLISKDDVIRANQIVHSTMATTYNSEPHFKIENKLKTRRRLESMLPGKRNIAIDLGAGTGFLTSMLVDYFQEVIALDVTEQMLNLIPKLNNCTKVVGSAEETGYPNDTFDMVTCYSFLHHLFDPNLVLEEAFRILKPGGTLYFDLEPNSFYWKMMSEVNQLSESFDNVKTTDFIRNEINKTIYIENIVEKSHGIPPETFYLAEYSKGRSKGINPYEVSRSMNRIGFKEVKVNFDWFIGEGISIHVKGEQFTTEFREFIDNLSPFSNFLYKYFYGFAIK
jgi:ubiquinone/menaquinone biosynthesis C-methylase UbiE